MSYHTRNNIVRKWLSSVDTIFENRSIYKSIFICPSEYFEEYKTVLQKHDYPISTIYDIELFIEDKTRILLLDEIDIDLFDIILHRTYDTLMSKVDTVIVTSDCNDSSYNNLYCNHPQLNSVQNFYIG